MRLITLKTPKKLLIWFENAIELLRMVERHQAGESDEEILNTSRRNHPISPQFLASLNLYFEPLLHFLPEMRQVYDQLSETSITVETVEATRKTEVEERNVVLRNLEVATRGAMSTLLAQQKHLKNPEAAPIVKALRGERPKNRSLQWTMMADTVTKVHRSLLKLGYPPLTAPTIEDIQTLKEKTLELDARVRLCQGSLIVYREELHERKREAQELFAKIAAYLKYYYSKNTRPQIRDIMRIIGYTFKPLAKPKQARG